MIIVNPKYGEAILAARAKAKPEMNQIQLAIRAGMSRQQLRAMELSTNAPNATSMARLMSVLPALKPGDFFVQK